MTMQTEEQIKKALEQISAERLKIVKAKIKMDSAVGYSSGWVDALKWVLNQ